MIVSILINWFDQSFFKQDCLFKIGDTIDIDIWDLYRDSVHNTDIDISYGIEQWYSCIDIAMSALRDGRIYRYPTFLSRMF